MKVSVEPVVLEFSPTAPGSKPLRDSLSAVARSGDQLWIASDESASAERLSFRGKGLFDSHRTFSLCELLDLECPKGKEARVHEIDIEGIDLQDEALWVVGSHSLKREKADPTASPDEGIRNLAQVKAEANRYTLGRIPLEPDATGGWQPPSSAPAATLRRSDDGRGDALTWALQDDPHLGPFFSVPGKDNGFDVEGLAVTGDRLFLGLRGPVLRGWAVILELEWKLESKSNLKLKRIGKEDRRYRKHFLPLGGLGIRELCIRRDDLLILAGPTMDLDGPVTIFRWKDALKVDAESLVSRASLEVLFQVPFGQGPDAGKDHAEGIALFSDSDSSFALFVVYDSPSEGRKVGSNGVRADLIEFRTSG